MSLDSLLEAAPEVIAGFFNFLINFATKPRATLQPYQGRGKIDPKLISYVSLSVGLSFVVALIASAIGVAEDPSQTLTFIRSFEPELLPIVVIVLILGITILLHVAARVYISLMRITPGALDAHLGGSIQDSINASFGFSAFFVPLTTLLFSALLVAANQNPDSVSPIVPGIVGLGLAVVLLIYYPAALSATHPNTSYLQGAIALAASVTGIYLLGDLLARLF